MKPIPKQVRGGSYLWILLIVGALAVFFTFTKFVALSAFGAALAKTSIAWAMYYVLVRYVINPWIHVKSLLEQSPVALAIYLLGYAVIAGLCISTA